MNHRVVSPNEANALKAQGATIVDIREPADFNREHIPQAIALPLSEIQQGKVLPAIAAHASVIFYCQSGMRTRQNVEMLISAAHPAEVLLLDGGIGRWRQEKLPTVEDKKQPLPMMRQVQIAAGSLIILGVILGYGLDTGFFLLSGFVGAGLIFAGISGWCGMATLLAKMPWNKAR